MFGVCLGFDSRPNFEKCEWVGREGVDCFPAQSSYERVWLISSDCVNAECHSCLVSGCRLRSRTAVVPQP